MDLDVVIATGRKLVDWRAIHNLIIPTSRLSADQVAERSRRHRLTLGYVAGEIVGNATVRPPQAPGGIATVIVRILPEHRRQGYGTAYLRSELGYARDLGAGRIETVVLASNTEGLAFARAHSFIQHDRYLLESDTVPFVDLHLAESPQP